MSRSEDFKRIAELFLETVDLPSESRATFLREACGEDNALRSSVEKLLAQDARGSVLGDPAVEETSNQIAASVEAPRYQIIERIGEGGTATVYRARDTKLDRIVALKVLSSRLASEPDAVQRFEREAKAAASLDHPNVCPIYEIDHSGDQFFIAMAFLEGMTLEEKLEADRLYAATALDIAIQTCRGLAAAHTQGIVHRDVKPANLMITATTAPTQLVRILDFGVARLAKRSQLTQEGLAIGTISYMAPEQVEGTDVDERADLWALGAVLYHMLVGAPPFPRESTREEVAAILGADPLPPSANREDLPPAVDSIIRRALAKVPAERYQSASDMAGDLGRALRSMRSETEAFAPAARPEGTAEGGIRAKRWGLLAAAGVLVFLGLYMENRPDVGERPLVNSSVVPFTTFEGVEAQPAISPDESRIAYVWDGESEQGRTDLYVQLTGTLSPLRLTDTPQPEHSPVWSPDGTRIAFLRSGEAEPSINRGPHAIMVVSAMGGVELEVARVATDGPHRELDWAPSGRWLASRDGDGLVLIDLERGGKTPVWAPDTPGVSHCPRFDPRGERLGFLRESPDSGNSVYIVPLADGEPRRLAVEARDFAWSSDGESLLLSMRNELVLLRLRDESLQPTGIKPAKSVDARGSALAFERTTINDNIWSLELAASGAAIATRAEKLIASSVHRQVTPQFSPDGASITFSSNGSGNFQIWSSDRRGENLRKLTSLEAILVGTPRWSPDGRSIVFDATLTRRSPTLFTLGALGRPQRLTPAGTRNFLASWSRNGEWIYFCSDRSGEPNIWRIRPDGSESTQVSRDGGFEAFESNDGKYLFFSSAGSPKRLSRLRLEDGSLTDYPELGDVGRYWAVADKGIYFVDRLAKPDLIQYLDLESREITVVGPIGRLSPATGGLSISPDGRTLLYTQRDIDNTDVMLLRVPE